MEAIESEFLKRNVYEYFKYCYLEKNVCGAGIITSKQFVFYTQTDKYDHRTHDEIYVQIEQAIHIASKTEKPSKNVSNSATSSPRPHAG